MSLLRRLLVQHHFLSNCSARAASSVARQKYDVIVVGGGHAGTEAAAAATRTGAETLLITQKIETIGALSCNPSLGGVGKGQLVKEVDALDGLMGRAGDYAGVHFSILNRRKGPAVWGPRAQLDRGRYKEFIQSELLNMPRLTVIEGSVEGLLVSTADPERPGKHRVTGVRLADGSNEILSSSVVLTTGTFLSGSLFMGKTTSPGGRMGEPPSCAGLTHSLREILGLKLGRLKTGTPPRIVKETVDFSLAQLHLPDSRPTPFSFINTHTHCKPEEQIPCHLTYTTPGVDRVVRESLHMNSHIQQDTKGPRYCPSIESRVLRFPGRQHQVWLEPEGLNSDLLYPQGLSMTMPPEMQLRLIREIPALQRADIRTPGYGVQYDFVCPTQLFPWLQLKSVQGLFLAGQINGTTGYEEAAAQGLWAGVNAGRTALSLPPLSLSRTESYIGVLIDDLVGHGVTEPYRMFTSRAEFRTSLRPDNADLRLTPKGFEEIGCVSSHRYLEAVRVRQGLSEALSALQSVTLSPSRWREKLRDICISETKSTLISGEEMLQYKDVSFNMVASAFPEILSPHVEFSERIKIEAVYRPHCEKQQREMERMREEESLSLPPDIDYFSLPVSLSDEVREILDKARPSTLGAATRLQGVTPAAIVHLLNYVTRTGRRSRAQRETDRRTKIPDWKHRPQTDQQVESNQNQEVGIVLQN
ncbi:protein MTO1 homolog, mitochondrial [Colossoma macropomum]|uniref:protein MTO1 homolog, mitochondrial n=1 Tax=Colossoma macropomum TaxID=42526 RepID=UPI0018653553|nr:protein MTO1 homolog, mitochondrial [Colossoma macropomum]XP_036429146.1 protein MTO1 homolog, mitochondrial [Colossoma macropomum]